MTGVGPLPYIGGKRRLAGAIVRRIPAHTTYVEPFAGGCRVFFRKPESKVEVLNDLDEEVVGFLRVTQNHPLELARTLAFAAPSRRLHALYASQNPATLTDIQRAARFLYAQKNSFGGRINRQAFRFGVSKPSGFDPGRLPEVLQRAAERLRGALIECDSYERVLKRYDRPSTFFYLDPPYVGVDLYRHNLPDEEFFALARRLASISGRFLLSINDCALSREAFAAFRLEEVTVSYTAARSVPKFRELLVSNYDTAN